MSALIGNNCDDCNVNITREIDTALELTKLYYKYRDNSHYVHEDTIYKTYKYYKDIIEEEKNGEENEDYE